MQHATSKDPSVDPEFDPRYFDEEVGMYTMLLSMSHVLKRIVDLQVWVEMVKFCRNLRNISPLKEMTGGSGYVTSIYHWLMILVVKEHNPGPEVQTDEQIVGTSE